MNQSKTSAETPAPVKDQTTSPRLGQPGAGAPTPKNSPGKSGGTPDGNLSLPGNGKAEDAFPDPAELSHQIAKRSRELVAEFLKAAARKGRHGNGQPPRVFRGFGQGGGARVGAHRGRARLLASAGQATEGQRQRGLSVRRADDRRAPRGRRRIGRPSLPYLLCRR